MMAVIRCEFCNGTGKEPIIITDKYVHKLSKGAEIENCPDCGGSGCKWVEDINNESEK